ncbi:hypothetical protein DVB69_12355 [Sporosarcina sp. BI001-red]|uniref:hypothetical protein n=1 Tax=Sporosarcina sp. BI001-red TaxID=2282866 RepID=UPI000E27A0DA|nr:hypothetical protein [Sporosarcina sp. BI001-red]REB06491.1 hypothetical protein DVB69_12355 [Sporosarcina sp. BI001-red]
MKKTGILFGVFLLILSIPHERRARACSCMEPPSVSVAQSEADAVFLGMIIDIADMDIRREVTVDVHEAWKGIKTKTIKIYTGHNSGDCGLPIEIGESYLFYANDWSERSDKGFLTSTICTRTATEANAREDLVELGVGKKEFTQAATSSSATSHSPWFAPTILGSIALLFLLSWFLRKKRLTKGKG